MSHTDYIKAIPKDFKVIATTDNCPTAAICNEGKALYAVQFHPEVTHTEYGKEILKNFLFEVCKCSGERKGSCQSLKVLQSLNKDER